MSTLDHLPIPVSPGLLREMYLKCAICHKPVLWHKDGGRQRQGFLPITEEITPDERLEMTEAYTRAQFEPSTIAQEERSCRSKECVLPEGHSGLHRNTSGYVWYNRLKPIAQEEQR